MKRLSGLLLILFVFVFSLKPMAQRERFDYLTTSEGLSHNMVVDIVQDKDGFIWAATGEGLARYDSFGFKIFYAEGTPNSIPSNEVQSLLVSKSGKLFIGTSKGLCSFNPDYDNFTGILYGDQSLGFVREIFQTKNGKILLTTSTGVYYMSEDGKIEIRLPLENNLGTIEEDASGNFWSYRGERLLNFDSDGKILKMYLAGEPDATGLLPSSISSIKIDSKNQLWIGTFRHGPFIFDSVNEKFNSIPLNVSYGDTHPMYFVRNMLETEDGKMWLATEKGLFIYDIESHDYEHYLQSFDPTIESINDNAVYKVFRSREDIIWLGTYFGGINIVKPVFSGFKIIKPGIKPDDLKGKALSQMIIGPNKKLWIATEDAGIAIYDFEQKSFQHILNTLQKGATKISSNVHALTVDKHNNVWSGNFLGGINKISPSDYKIENYIHVPGDPKSLENNFVFSLYDDSNDVLWVGTSVGVDLFDKTTKEFSRFKPKIFSGKFVYEIFNDEQGNVWLSTYNDHGVFRYNVKRDEITQFVKDSTNDLISNSFISHCIDKRGKIWFGTRGGGLVLFDPDNQKMKTFDIGIGLSNNVIYGILEDEYTNLWLSSNKGISKFNYLSGSIQNFTVDHGLVGNQFNYKSYLKTDDGTMYFGAVNGLTYFHPDEIKTLETEPEVHFTNFRLFNNPVLPGENSVLQKSIDQTSEIRLKYNQNVISFDFIALDMFSRGKNNFSYFMEGLENNWHSAMNSQNATYTSLPPGDYRFRIKATNIYDFPNAHERSIKLVILPPIWKTGWAYFIYFLIICGLIYLFYKHSEIRHKEKMTLRIEKIEKEKLNEIHQHKINFFTYISHEFKTPLTIILATLEAFFSGETFPSDYKKRMSTLKRNALRLQFLINQLMDFRKIETDHVLPNLQSGDVIQYLHDIFNAFNTLFARKNIEAVFVSECEKLIIQFDPDKLEKIVSNLLSNAFKYTQDNGVVSLKISTYSEANNNFLKIIVADTGCGISEEKLTKIFNLFYKIEDDENEYPGSGIGLTLTQSLVKVLNGNIHVESEQGKGTTFTVSLPFQEKNRRDEKTNISLKLNIIDDLLSQSLPKPLEQKVETTLEEFEILFVEDNKELQKFLCEHFKSKYSTRSTNNGKEALTMVNKRIPDLIITDLMMPKMDGIELCRELKSNFEYCHVPVIMLTAKSDVESRIESLEVGADHYLSKPFILSELELQIRNILSMKANLKKHFLQFGTLQVEHPIKNRDQQFIEKISILVLANIENPEFGVTEILNEFGISRTLLHTKLKQILDLSATEFINTIRLKEAQQMLLEQPELTMAEVAYKVGFSDPNYFGRIFKKLYNVTPSNFRSNNAI